MGAKVHATIAHLVHTVALDLQLAYRVQPVIHVPIQLFRLSLVPQAPGVPQALLFHAQHALLVIIVLLALDLYTLSLVLVGHMVQTH